MISTLRRECTDLLIPFTAGQLEAHLHEIVTDYNTSRTHESLDGDPPVSRPIAVEPACAMLG